MRTSAAEVSVQLSPAVEVSVHPKCPGVRTAGAASFAPEAAATGVYVHLAKEVYARPKN